MKNYYPKSILFRQKVGRGYSRSMEIFDAIVLNVLRKCNGCEAWLCVMVGRVEGVGWLCLCSRDSSAWKFYSSSSAHKAVSCHVDRQLTMINHYVQSRVGMGTFSHMYLCSFMGG